MGGLTYGQSFWSKRDSKNTRSRRSFVKPSQFSQVRTDGQMVMMSWVSIVLSPFKSPGQCHRSRSRKHDRLA